ncbi:T9SS type A sorting domain-containing protein [Lacinutrix sp. C3R15]|uniref:T9SS type A sorting domain-containing protein n=1 Tax=Flavobacteriaceae TaxID=49546 RepID=UPI001C0A2ACF|nr:MULTISPECIES: T9SS type A sorting domain-containing protein [Flavobacteriaceae]MBU2939053.1 T9SS type A sorting domain-containing protein [Lacinutrix sp. C3R15]MDO6622368.1 T9SS type A sorting domain-containing protein [Oceanihabitans sp. 1_MG-2023]
MKKIYFLLLTLLITTSLAAQNVFINELHYDNTGSDTGEGFEIAGPAGTDLSGWEVVLYNGSNSSEYDTVTLSGIIPNEGMGYGTLAFFKAGIQNGAPDGLALVDNTDTIIQFLSYEGVITINEGTAEEMTSTDIGVSETSSTPVGSSLQLIGSGTTYGDFTWSSPSTSSFGSLNSNQGFTLGTNLLERTTFFVYPNPVTNGTVTIKTNNNQALQVSVFDVLGKQVLAQNVANQTLNVSNLTAGVYILKLTQNGNSTTKKLVIK